MKRFIIILIAGMLMSAKASAQSWEWQNPSPDGQAIQQMAFADSLTGWAVGGYGTILKTSDGGVTWVVQDASTQVRFEGVSCAGRNQVWATGWNWRTQHGAIAHSMDGGETWTVANTWQDIWFKRIVFADSLNGWAAGSGRILHTTNGGQLWQSQLSNNNFGLYGFAATDTANAWAAGYDYFANAAVILHTSDGGVNWEQQPANSGGHLWDVSFADPDTGWVVGLDLNILNTTDGGQTWTEQISQAVSPYAVHFLNGRTGWIYCYDDILLHTSNGGTTWDTLTVSTHSYPRDVYFADEQYGWLCGSGGNIFQTTDGGQTWSARTSGSDVYLNGVCFVDTSLGWVSGSYGTVLHTTNGGVNWTAQNTGVSYHFLADVRFVNAMEGWAGGSIIIHTTDGGDHWQAQDSTLPAGLERMAFSDNMHGWGVGLGGTLIHTSDGGVTWQTQSCPVTNDLLSVACTDSLRAWAVSYLTSSTYDCYVLNTTDGGENWNIQANPAYATMWSISMQDSLNGWIAGYNLFNGLATLWQTQNGGAQWMPHTLNYATDLLAVKAVGQTVLAASDWGLILRSTNNGAVFTADTSGTDNSLWDLALVGADHAWAVGPSGTILRCVIEPSATDDRTLPLAQTYTLSAYPNPFNPISVIELSLPHAQRVRIAVYDVEGRLVKMLADRVIPAGKQQFTFDGSRLSSGIYFARAESGDFAKSLRLVLLK